MSTRRTLLIVALSLLIAISAPAAALYWLCYTEPGVRWLAARVTKVGPARIHIDGVQGRLAGPLSVARLEIDHDRAHVIASDIRTDVSLRSLLLQTVRAESLDINAVEVTIKRRSRPPRKRAPRFTPRWLRLQAPAVTIASARLTLLNGRVLSATGIRAASGVTTDTLTVERAVLVSEEIELRGSGVLRARTPLQLAGDLDWTVRPARQPPWAGRLNLKGDLDRLDLNGRVAEPIAADLAGVLSDLTGDWRWEAHTGVDDFTLKSWLPDSKVRIRTVVLSGSGNREDFGLKGTLLPVVPETGPLDVSFKGSYADRTLRAEGLRISQQSGKATLEASGSVRFGGEAPGIDVRAQWRDLAWPLTSDAVLESPQGDLTLNGELPYRHSASAELRLPKAPPLRISSEGELDRQQIRFERLLAQTDAGEVQAEGAWRWADEKTWRVSAEARGLDPATVDARFPGRLTFHLAAEGAGLAPGMTWKAELRDLRGQLRTQPVSGRAGVSHQNGSYRFANVNLRFGDAHLEAGGRYGDQHDLSWQLSVPDVAQLVPEARGALHSRGTMSGTGTAPRIITSLSAQALAYDSYRLGRLEAEADVDLADQRASHVQLSGSNLELRGVAVSSAAVVLDGRASAHQLSVLVDADVGSLSLRTQAGYDEGMWQGQFVELDAGMGAAALKLTAPARYVLGKERIELERLCLAGTSERLCAHGGWRRDERWSIALDASGVPLRVLAARSPQESEYSGVLTLQATAQQDPGRPWVGKASGTFADGLFRYRRANGQLESVPIGAGRAAFEATPERFSGEIHLDATEAASLDAQARAERTVAADWKRLPFSGSLHAETRELGFVPVLAREIDRASGSLTADLELAGTVGAPEIAGALILQDGELDLYAVNLQLREIGMRVDLRGTGLKLAARAHAGQGVAELDGELEWRNRQPHGRIRLQGENLDLVNVPEARVRVSPNLRFRIDGRNIGVDGAVRIPSAFLTPADLSGAVLPSSDEVLVDPEARPSEPGFRVTTGIQLVLGKDVRVDSYGLEARIEGNIAAYAAPDEVSTATGELKVAEGKYSAYTRELDIERGRLIFTGGPLSDPGVDLRARKQFPEAVVGVNVRGTLRNPRLSFWSDPSLPQSQIASLIVTGGHLDVFQNRNGADTQGGRDTLLAQGSAILASQLGQHLGLDLEEVRFESDINDQTRLVLGRYLSPRFYVSYGISLTEAINTLKLRYTINDRWTVRSEAGEHRSADLEYKIER